MSTVRRVPGSSTRRTQPPATSRSALRVKVDAWMPIRSATTPERSGPSVASSTSTRY